MLLEVKELIRGVVSVKTIGELKKSDLDQMRGGDTSRHQAVEQDPTTRDRREFHRMRAERRRE